MIILFRDRDTKGGKDFLIVSLSLFLSLFLFPITQWEIEIEHEESKKRMNDEYKRERNEQRKIYESILYFTFNSFDFTLVVSIIDRFIHVFR